MRLAPIVVVAVSFLSCTPDTFCSPDTCFGCCREDGVCSACPEDGGGGGTAGGGTAGGGTAGGTAGGATAGGTGGGSAGGGTAGGSTAGGSGGGTTACTSGNSCNLPADAGYGLCCGGVCKRYTTDVQNCGGCGTQCAAGSKCSSGRCTVSCDGGACPGGTQCTTSQYSVLACYPSACTGLPDNTFCARNDPYSGRCCGNACLDTFDDPLNCGSCGVRCGAGQDCLYGSCYPRADCTTAPAGTSCRAGTSVGQCCGGACVTLDTRRDRENCGGCGLHCPVGDVCTDGQCQRPDAGWSLGCYTSPAQCAPGTSCNASQAKCVTDTCASSTFGMPCAGGGNSVCCNVGCVDLYSDPNNCAACGHACGAGQFCDYGSCKPTPTCGLANSGVDCPAPGGGVGQCCGGTCVNRQTNANNCGACSASCPAGDVCKQGTCMLPDGGWSGGCAGQCPAGTTCDGNKCLPLRCAVGSTGEVCGFGAGVGSSAYQTVTGRCCNGACVDLGQDPAHCSQCGAACASGLCIAGSPFGGPFGSMCYAQVSTSCSFGCPSDMFCAGGRCNPKTCQSFSGGTCLTSASQAGMCCPQGFSSTCINPTSDPQHCGGCGISCGAGATCNNGVCSTIVPPCTAGHLGQFCDLDAGTSRVCCPGGGCIDTLTDNRNCGRCGGACGSGLTCVSGACLALACSAAVQNQACADDGGSPGTCCSSACVHRQVDPLNCGQCGRSCVGAETCAGSACGLDVCEATTQGSVCHRDAGSFVATGVCCSSACLDTRTDRNNCGGCGRVCPGTTSCVGGNCQ